MSTDPNWLYSTIAQSSAALVAIVGGFVLSRLLTVAGERSAVQMRLEELRADLEPKQREFSLLRDRRLRWDVSDKLLTSKVFDALLASKGELALVDAVEIASFREYPAADLQPVWDELCATTKAILALLGEHSGELPYDPDEVEAYLEKRGISANTFALRVFYRSQKAPRQRPVSASANSAASVVAAIQQGATVQLSPGVLLGPEVEREKRARYERLGRDVAELERDIAPIKQKIDDLESHLRSLRRPSGTMRALAVLVLFAIVGIVVPVLMLPVSGDSFTQADRWMAVGLFLAGLVLFFGYLLSLARSL